MVSIGLNPYGIAYCNGLMAQGMPRANPRPNTLEQYITLAQQLGVSGIELDVRQLSHLDEMGLTQVRERLEAIGFFVVLSLCPPILEGLSRALLCAFAGSLLAHVGRLEGRQPVTKQNVSRVPRLLRVKLRRHERTALHRSNERRPMRAPCHLG